jgi:diguanylate cyclase (GGDEF)-like protein
MRVHKSAGDSSEPQGEAPRRLTTTYILGLGLIAAVAVVAAYANLSALSRQAVDARVISVAAGQSAISYEITETVNRLVDGAGTDAIADLRDQSAELLAQQDALTNGSVELGLPVPRPEVAVLLSSIDASVEALATEAEGLAAAEGAVPTSVVESLGANAELLRFGMNIVVVQHQSAVAGRVEGLRRTNFILATATLALLLFEGLFLFRPAARQVRDASRKHQESHNESLGRLNYLSEFDSLTGLANRRVLEERLTATLAEHTVDGGLVSLFYIDLHGFEAINALVGHDGGDDLLKRVARRLIKVQPDAHTVARVGGDEFAIIYEAGHRLKDSEVLADRVVRELSKPYDLNGEQMSVGVSVGAAVFPLDGDQSEDLMRGAAIALNSANEAGANTFRFLSAELRAETSEKHTIIEGLRHAIEQQTELRLVYQPKVSLSDLSLIGVEALIRWDHPSLGTIQPNRFIPLAEESDLILAIDKWVLKEAVSQACDWERQLGIDVPVSVNISSRQFRRGDLVNTIAVVIEETGLNPSKLEIEITEGTLIEDIDGARLTLQELRDMGVRVSVDDFGTGYSSLSYLKKFPVDILKIDQSFVDEVTEDPDDAAISRAIVNMARSLRLKVIAEGVETIEQLEFLRRLGCDAAQGFHFSRPVDPDKIGELYEAASEARATA